MLSRRDEGSCEMADYWEGFDIGPTCPTCGAAINPGSSFCTTCGASLSAMTPVSMAAGETCATCGAPLNPGASFCIMCGAPVGGGRQQQQPVRRQATAPGVCPNCGEPLDPSAAFCIMCGTPIDLATAVVSGPRGVAVTPPLDTGNATDHAVTTVLDVGDDYRNDSSVTTVMDVGGSYQRDSAVTTVIGVGDRYQNDSSVTTVVDVGGGEDFEPGMPTPMPKPTQRAAQRTAKGQTHLLRDTGTMADDDDPTVRPHLLMLTYDEARSGCHKRIDIDGETLEVDIPAGVDATTRLDVDGYGYYDEMTRERGALRLSFFLI